MQSILIIVHAPPYGSERCLSALRLATALAGHDDKPAIDIFLMSDATVLGLPNQIDGAGNGLQGMVEQLVASGVGIKLCRTCAPRVKRRRRPGRNRALPLPCATRAISMAVPR